MAKEKPQSMPASGSAVTLGRYISYWFEKTPRRALHYFSYYKFAARMIGKEKRVLDIGCNEGLGTWLLAKECGFAKGVDLDDQAVKVAKENWKDESIDFECADFLQLQPQPWDALVSFDVVEHILPEHVDSFFADITQNLVHNGIAVIGTPSLEGQQYASQVSKAGHVNVYSFERLEAQMSRHFGHVFMFSANDEVIHTGFPRMAHYLIAVGCRKKAA
jgi:2-polyprenyl-3-methyl-5-hydroxy-6-metoxy-1,4-benzoquinol methylase